MCVGDAYYPHLNDVQKRSKGRAKQEAWGDSSVCLLTQLLSDLTLDG